MAVFGVWMWPESVQTEGAHAVVSRLARIGATDIFFLTKGLAGTTSYQSRIAPPCCERDLLGELLDAAHGAGMHVHAWLTSASDVHYKTLHPESGRYHLTRGRDKELISLTDEGYIAYMQQVIRELCAGYPIDGLHLDYIRYNHLLYGWSEEDCARYAAEGADLPHLRELMERTFLQEEKSEPDCIFDAFRAGDESALALSRTRRKDVVRFAKAMIAAAKDVKSILTLSAALMPEGAYEDTAFSDLHYGQNYEDAAALYEFALPMAYSMAYEKDAGWVLGVAKGTMRRGMKTLVGLHAYEGGTGETLKNDIDALKHSDAEGACLFRYGAFVLAEIKDSTACLFNPTKTPITSLRCRKGDEFFLLDTSIGAGEEQCFPLPFAPDLIEAFSGDTPVCVYLAPDTP